MSDEDDDQGGSGHGCRCGRSGCVEPVREAADWLDGEVAAAINLRLGVQLDPRDIAAILRILCETIEARHAAGIGAERASPADDPV